MFEIFQSPRSKPMFPNPLAALTSMGMFGEITANHTCSNSVHCSLLPTFRLADCFLWSQARMAKANGLDQCSQFWLN